MNNPNSQNQLENLLSLGVFSLYLSTVVAFCAKKQKAEAIKDVSELVEKIVNSFSEAEKQELKDDFDQALKQKAEELAGELGSLGDGVGGWNTLVSPKT